MSNLILPYSQWESGKIVVKDALNQVDHKFRLTKLYKCQQNPAVRFSENREESRYYELQDKLINFVNKMQVKLLSSSKKLNERIDRTVPIFVLGEQKTERIKSFESSKFQLIVTNVSIAAVDL